MNAIEQQIALLKAEHAKVVELAQRAAQALQNAAMQQARLEGGIAALEAQQRAAAPKVFRLAKQTKRKAR